MATCLSVAICLRDSSGAPAAAALGPTWRRRLLDWALGAGAGRAGLSRRLSGTLGTSMVAGLPNTGTA